MQLLKRILNTLLCSMKLEPPVMKITSVYYGPALYQVSFKFFNGIFHFKLLKNTSDSCKTT